jgi:hypothetical protein
VLEELTARCQGHHRKIKLRKLKAKLAAANNSGDTERILFKIQSLSPFWKEPEEQAAK